MNERQIAATLAGERVLEDTEPAPARSANPRGKNDATAPESGPRLDRRAFVIAILTALIALAYAAYTNHAWEDYYITFRASKNMALGKGLVYTEGQRVQTFTSPLGAILPGVLSWITGNHSDQLALWLFRIVSVAALAGSVAVTSRTFRRWGVNGFFAVCGMLMLATDCKSVDNTINGMETGFMLFFTSLTVCALSGPLDRKGTATLAAGFCGLMWTRPDGFIPAGALLAAFFVFRAGAFENADGRIETGNVFKAIGWSIVFYLPWLLFAFAYYGTPIPNTILAKSMANGLWERLAEVVPLSPLGFSKYGFSMQDTFTPAYERNFSGWPWWVGELSKVATLAAAFHWLFPIASRQGRATSLACLALHVYLSFVSPIVFPWYVPPATYLTVLSLMCLLEALPSPRPAPPFQFLSRVRPGRIFAGGLVCLTAGLLAATAPLYARQERFIEIGNRKPLGEWLHAHGAPGDTVFVECLGYIGYFSGLKMYDYPGLSSPEVIATRKALRKAGQPDDWALIIERLQPTWLVLRPSEITTISGTNPVLLHRDYQPSAVFDVSKQINDLPNIPGNEYLAGDEVFAVFKRAPAPTVAAK